MALLHRCFGFNTDGAYGQRRERVVSRGLDLNHSNTRLQTDTTFVIGNMQPSNAAPVIGAGGSEDRYPRQSSIAVRAPTFANGHTAISTVLHDEVTPQ